MRVITKTVTVKRGVAHYLSGNEVRLIECEWFGNPPTEVNGGQIVHLEVVDESKEILSISASEFMAYSTPDPKNCVCRTIKTRKIKFLEYDADSGSLTEKYERWEESLFKQRVKELKRLQSVLHSSIEYFEPELMQYKVSDEVFLKNAERIVIEA